jgi:ribosomal protein S18 acetylase RimI-like enzyme
MQKKDLHDMLRLGQMHWKNESWLTMDYLKASFEQKGHHYVALDGENIVGGVIFIFEDIVENWVRYLIVDKTYRRQGIARKLVEKIFKTCKRGQSVFVDTGVIDKKAIKFYERMGFKNRGMVKSLYHNAAAYFFEKNIS